MAFELYLPDDPPTNDVSISRHGITISREAMDRFNLTDLTAGTLLWDPSRSLIGIVPAIANDRSACRVTDRPEGTGKFIVAREFFAAFGIEAENFVVTGGLFQSGGTLAFKIEPNPEPQATTAATKVKSRGRRPK